MSSLRPRITCETKAACQQLGAEILEVYPVVLTVVVAVVVLIILWTMWRMPHAQ